MSLQQAPVPGMAPPFDVSAPTTTDHDDKKKKLRGLFGFGKKKGADAAGGAKDADRNSNAIAKDAATTSLKPAPTLVPTSATSSPPKTLAKEPRKPTSPIQTHSFSGLSGVSAASNYSGVLPPSSPGRSVAALSSSPRISSPAGSQIFERDVQESSSVPMPNSPAIPSHITTENMIPPVLDASSEAITDGQLDPDTVEIITHTNHLTVAGGVPASSPGATGSFFEDLASSFTEKSDKTDKEKEREDAFDDVRRLSFISFADVVQAEQQQQQYQQASGSLAGLASLGSSPSPSKSGSVKGLELSPRKGKGKAVGSPTRSPKLAAATSITTSSSTLLSGSDILVETMSQALRRTASGDLGGMRSTPQSPV